MSSSPYSHPNIDAAASVSKPQDNSTTTTTSATATDPPSSRPPVRIGRSITESSTTLEESSTSFSSCGVTGGSASIPDIPTDLTEETEEDVLTTNHTTTKTTTNAHGSEDEDEDPNDDDDEEGIRNVVRQSDSFSSSNSKPSPTINMDILVAIGMRDWATLSRLILRSSSNSWLRIRSTVVVRGCKVRLLPLSFLCTCNPPLEIVELILFQSTEASKILDKNGRYALHWAVDAHGSSSSVIQALIRDYPEATQRQEDKFGFLPLHIACFFHPPSYSEISTMTSLKEEQEDSMNIIQALIQAYPEGASVPDFLYGWIPLHILCRTCCYADIVKLLLTVYPQGAKIRDREGRLPLHWACCHKQPLDNTSTNYNDTADGTTATFDSITHYPNNAEPMVTSLIQIYPEAATKRERTFGFLPLHIACASSASIQVIQRLLEIYPDATRKQDKNGSLPLHITCRANASPEIISLLLGVFSDAAQFQDADCRLPLHWACHVNPTSELAIATLLHSFPDAAQLTEAKYGYLPLHVACKRGASEAVIANLIAAFPEGSRVRDNMGNLPIHIACNSSDFAVSEGVIGLLLLAFPESLQRTDQNGCTPLMVAQENPILHPNKYAITGLLQSHPSAWKNLSFPIRLKFLEFKSPALEKSFMAAIKRDQEANKSSLLYSADDLAATDDDEDAVSTTEDATYGSADWKNRVRRAPSVSQEQVSFHHLSECFDSNNHEYAVTSSSEQPTQIVKCVLCGTEPVRYILYPCGHPCLCEDCAEEKLANLDNVCPVGGCAFQDLIRVHGTIVGGANN